MLFKKMLRDMRFNLSQFISIFLMAFLSVFVFCGIAGEWMGIRDMADKFYSDTNFADVQVFSTSGIDAEGLQRVKNIAEVQNAQRRILLDAKAELPDSSSIEVYILESDEISKPYIADGAAFDLNSEGIWLDKRFAEANSLALGDEITVSYGGMSLTKNIAGLVHSPEYVYRESDGMTPDFKNKGFAFVAATGIPEPALFYSQLIIKSDTKDYLALEEKISAALDGGYSVFITRDNFVGYNQFAMEVEQHRAMGIVFPPIFVLVALLTMLTTMTRLVAAQRTQIGTLKAIGFSKRKITLHYIGYGFWLSLLGAILGVVFGPIALPPLFYPSMSAFYTLPAWVPSYNISFYVMGALTVLISTLTTFIACRKVLSLNAADSLRAKTPKVPKEKKQKENLPKKERASKIYNKLGFNLQWNIRDAARNKTRTVMTLVGALGCAALLICAFSMNGDMKDTKDWQYGQMYRFESKITVSEAATPQNIDAILAATDGEAILETAIEVRSDVAKYTGMLLVTENDGGSLIAFTDKNRKGIALPTNGITISYKMAELLGVGVGDRISWHLFSEEGWKEAVISGIYRSPTVQGLTMTQAVFESAGYAYVASAVVSAEHITALPDGADKIMYVSDLVEGWDELSENMMLMVYILILAAVILAVVVLYNLGVLSFTEMYRELATLKVIGFKSSKLRTLMLVQNLILTGIGFLIGIPFGLLLVKVMLVFMGDSFDMIAALHAADLIYSALIVLGVALLVNLMFSGKLKKVDMVSALKSSE